MSRDVDLKTVKPELDIYWDKQETDSKLQRYITEGKALLCDHAGKELQFTEGTFEGRLLVNYVSYAYNKLSEYFESNYQSDLIKLRLKHQGGSYGED